jgi:putative ABC transport system ATP-binding protein
MIRTSGLSKSIATASERISILEAVDMTVEAGETVAITGASGSGKSTLLGILAGLDIPSAGKVWLEQREITSMNEDQRAAVRRELVGFVFQSFQLLPSLTALENVMLPLELVGAKAARKQACDYLDQVGLQHRLRHYPRQLSGGEQQRVAIARAFVTRPRLLFADEPTGNLDVTTGQHINELLFALNRDAGATLILVTHDLSLSARCSVQFELRHGTVQRRATGASAEKPS